MQQTDEHQGRASSREPTHWMKARRFGVRPSEGLRIVPR
jgi:hypothetical protein